MVQALFPEFPSSALVPIFSEEVMEPEATQNEKSSDTISGKNMSSQ